MMMSSARARHHRKTLRAPRSPVTGEIHRTEQIRPSPQRWPGDDAVHEFIRTVRWGADDRCRQALVQEQLLGVTAGHVETLGSPRSG